MNKSELARAIAEDLGITIADATRAIGSFQKNIIKGVKESGKVSLIGFGTFSKVEKEARTARNPRTGETVNVDAKTMPKFKPGNEFVEDLNN